MKVAEEKFNELEEVKCKDDELNRLSEENKIETISCKKFGF